AFAAPRIARLFDTHGQRRVLLPLITVFAVATAVLIVAVELHLPTSSYFVPGAVAGTAMPAVGTLVRARWSVLLAGSPQLHTAFSFESVADEMVFVLRPVLGTLLATEVYPAAGLLVATVRSVAGVLCFVAQRGTEPPATIPVRPPPEEG